MLPDRVTIDVGLRDGLQNEATAVDTAGKLRLAEALLAAGVREMEVTSFVRPIGIANPRQVAERFAVLREALPQAELAAHFHDTRGMGLANVWAAVNVGITRFDASIAGLGGCPFAPGATGNIATEDTVHLLEEAGIATGIDREKIFAAADIAEELVGRPSAGRVKKAERAAAARVA